MEKDDFIRKFESGKCTEAELKQIEDLILAGELDPLDFPSLNEVKSHVDFIEYPNPGIKLEEGFYANLAQEKRKISKRLTLPSFSFSLFSSGWGIAAYTVIILLVGYAINSRQNNNELLIDELRQMKEVMLLTLIEEESTSDRLKAVSMSAGMDDASQQIIIALFKTLNEDSNDNVRLAALEALVMYRERAEVRLGLVESIGQQESPMVQIALAEVMAGIQEKSSIEGFQKLLDNENTPDEVKEKLKETINILI